MAEPTSFRSKHPLWQLFAVVTLFVIVVPATLWGIVQLYEVICSWCGCCEGLPRVRGNR